MGRDRTVALERGGECFGCDEGLKAHDMGAIQDEDHHIDRAEFKMSTWDAPERFVPPYSAGSSRQRSETREYRRGHCCKLMCSRSFSKAASRASMVPWS